MEYKTVKKILKINTLITFTDICLIVMLFITLYSTEFNNVLFTFILSILTVLLFCVRVILMATVISTYIDD